MPNIKLEAGQFSIQSILAVESWSEDLGIALDNFNPFQIT